VLYCSWLIMCVVVVAVCSWSKCAVLPGPILMKMLVVAILFCGGHL